MLSAVHSAGVALLPLSSGRGVTPPKQNKLQEAEKEDDDEAGRVTEWEGERIAESDMWWAF